MMTLETLRTALRLGVLNVASVLRYRLLKRLGYYARTLPAEPALIGPFLVDLPEADPSGQGHSCPSVEVSFFSSHRRCLTSPPDWFANRWNGTTHPNQSTHWSQIDDFDPKQGDIKTIWELSRMDWATNLAWEYRQGQAGRDAVLEYWLRDWTARNPGNVGINWKCGQETSLRAINLLVAALAMGNPFHKPRPGFLRLMEQHARRIAQTLHYAIAQDNNHGTSEAAALYAIGSYLERHAIPESRLMARRWTMTGERCLNERVAHLIMIDGSFSQQSLIYHRLMIDTLSFTELFRRHFEQNRFSSVFYQRASAAAQWLTAMVDPVSGDAPNLGDNDGAHLFRMSGWNYRDFRPSAGLASRLFAGNDPFEMPGQHPLAEIFGVVFPIDPVVANINQDKVSYFPDGGYAVIQQPHSWAMIRLPVFRFRPAHADALHVDLWIDGVNWLRDSGTYSYNDTYDGQDLHVHLASTRSHNTAQLDDRDQMPVLGRFLFGAWLSPSELTVDRPGRSIKAGYRDYLGGSHTRSLSATARGWRIHDQIQGFKTSAIVRWRLAPADWRVIDERVIGGPFTLSFTADGPLAIRLTHALESRCYLDVKHIPVVEVELTWQGTIVTEISIESGQTTACAASHGAAMVHGNQPVHDP